MSFVRSGIALPVEGGEESSPAPSTNATQKINTTEDLISTGCSAPAPQLTNQLAKTGQCDSAADNGKIPGSTTGMGNRFIEGMSHSHQRALPGVHWDAGNNSLPSDGNLQAGCYGEHRGNRDRA